MQDLTDFMREFTEYYFTQVHTSFPGVVSEYDAKTRRAIVQPSLKRRAGNKEYIPFPLLIDVPVLYPGTKKWTIHFPLEENDEVAVFFSERSLETWKDIGQDNIEDPDPRRFDLCDAYCVPGLQPIEFISAEETGLQIIHKDKFDGELISQVLMTDEKIELQYKKSFVEMEDDLIMATNDTLTAKLNGAKASLKNKSKNLFTVWDTHMKNIIAMKTVGSPCLHVIHPNDIQKLKQDNADMAELLEE